MAILEFDVTYTQRQKISIDTDKMTDAVLLEFQQMINSNVGPGDYKEIAEYIGHNYVYNSEEKFFEGLGDVREVGIKITFLEQNTEAEPWIWTE